ncbi:MAG: carbohydrate kinase family protein [Deltaproteobacteria bacterium]|nr:carbohydrate kinase family protein [Deltaproteobacteria bacterium]
MKDVVGIGALNLDLLYEVEDLKVLQEGGPFCAGGETSLPPMEFTKFLGRVSQVGTLRFRSAGGSAANTVVALARMGFKTGFVGRVGADEEGAFILQEMERADLSQVKRGGKSGICLAVLDRQRDRALLVQPHVNDSLRYEDMDLPYLSSTRYLHLSSFVGEGPLEASKQLMKSLPTGVRVSMDPGEFYARRGLKEVLPLIQRSSILFATAHEILTLTGKDDYRAGCKEILSLGPEVVVCKMGEEGAYLSSKERGMEFHPQGEAEVVDNTGAGDVYNAGFLAGLLLGRPLNDCLAFAHQVAAKSLGDYGRKRYPDAGDLKAIQR